MRRFWLACALVALVVAPATADAQYFFDNFDSYASGSTIAGQGGWETWGGAAGADTTVTSAQSYSSPNSLLVAGGADIVHQWGLTTGYWYAKAWTYVPGNQTGDMYFIILNLYDGSCASAGACNWSIQVRFSASEGVVENVGGSDNPRGIAGPIITGQWVELRVEIDLVGNQAYIYYNDVLLDSQVYNVSGVNAIAAFDLFSDGSSESYMDNVWLDTTIPVELQSFDIE